MSSLKELKEAFVSNHNGGPILEILLIIIVSPLSVWLRSYLYHQLYYNIHIKSHAVFYTIDTIVTIVPLLLSVTVPHFALVFFIICWYVFYVDSLSHFIPSSFSTTYISSNINENTTRKTPSGTYILPYLTEYRASLMLTTAMSILAVDFHIYPRRFCKAESFGLGLMDLGVGSFTFSNGFHLQNYAINTTNNSTSSRLYRVVVLLTLGFVRLITNRSVDYQEHVSEYGLHWNFFFTMAFSNLISSYLPHYYVKSSRHSILTATFIIISYQIYLTYYGGADYIISTTINRYDLFPFHANREGILSLFGYISLYLYGHATKLYLQRSSSIKLPLFIISIFIILMFSCKPSWISRRMCNLPYVGIILGINLFLISCFAHINTLYKKIDRSDHTINQYVSNHMLAVFLIANILTGLVNQCFDTFHMSAVPALIILSIYIILVGVILPFCLNLKKYKLVS